MRKIAALIIAVLLLVAPTVSAQQATLTTPVARASEDNLRVESSFITRDAGGRWEVTVSVRDGAGVEIRRLSYSGPDEAHPTATAAAFNTAVSHTVRSGEIGTDVRKTNYRILGFLSDKDYISALFGAVTLVP